MTRGKDAMDMDCFDKELDKRVLKTLYSNHRKNLPRVCNESLRIYLDVLEKHLTFPIKGTYEQEIGPLETTLCPITILKLHDTVDECYGILIKGIVGRKNKVIPLAEFTGKTTDHRNFQVIEEYKTWFWNYR
jgi:hypothetical protein